MEEAIDQAHELFGELYDFDGLEVEEFLQHVKMFGINRELEDEVCEARGANIAI